MKQAVLLARNLRAAAPSQGSLPSDRTLVRAALLLLTVAGPLRYCTGFPIKPHQGHLFPHLCSSHLYSHHLNLSSTICQLKITENNSQIHPSHDTPARRLTKRTEYCKISIEKGHCRWAAAPYAIGEIPRLRFGAKGGVFSFIFLLIESVWYIL